MAEKLVVGDLVVPEVLVEAVGRFGKETGCAGNAPLRLNDPDCVWLLRRGHVNVFTADFEAGEQVGRRRFLFNLEAPASIFGVPFLPAHREMGLLAIGDSETQLVRLPVKVWGELLREPEAASLLQRGLERWVGYLMRGIRPVYAPREVDAALGPGELSIRRGALVRPGGAMLWVRHLAGSSNCFGHANLYLTPQDGFLPIARDCWLVAEGEKNDLLALDTPEFLRQHPDPRPALNTLYGMTIECVKLAMLEELEVDAARIQESLNRDQHAFAGALRRLARTLDREKAAADTDLGDGALHTVFLQLGAALDVEIRMPQLLGSDPVREIAEASRLRYRPVTLTGDWWREDCGPLLAELRESGRPVALIPPVPGQFDLLDPDSDERTRVTAEVAATLRPEAFTFYRPLPARALKILDLLMHALWNSWRDITLIILMGLLGGAMSMALPIATSNLVDYVIPEAEVGELFDLVFGLMVATVAASLFQVTRGFALLRFETRADNNLEAAIWDRLLSLPATFFRQFTVGDLAMRANSINSIRSMLSEATMSTIFSSISSISSFFLLFYYSGRLALVACVLILIAILAIALSNWLKLRYQRQMLEVSGKLSGLILQLINGIAKLRVAAAEKRGFAVWARSFAEQRSLAVKGEIISTWFSVFNVGFTELTTITIFVTIAYYGGEAAAAGAGAATAVKAAVGTVNAPSVSTGNFMAFNAAFGQFLGAMLALASTGLQLLTIVPTLERAKPILETVPEFDPGRKDPGRLKGEIELTGVSFRYGPELPFVLHDVSIKARPGEFVAVVGPSGSGKSTVMRLLLGFEKPDSGSIYFDGQALKDLDVRRVRTQIGTVLQNGRVLAGDIFSNIVGSSLRTLDDAWAAAREAGFDDDVNQMPMGMHTFVVEGGSTLSGGQRQRLLIARSLVKKPRIIFFDEATSALDNRTQSIVSKSLEKLDATRIVIAHRLSTIIHADRIYVIVNGRVEQVGTYQELMAQPGSFAEIAKRQLV